LLTMDIIPPQHLYFYLWAKAFLILVQEPYVITGGVLTYHTSKALVSTTVLVSFCKECLVFPCLLVRYL
jgi:hypothetical protein